MIPVIWKSQPSFINMIVHQLDKKTFKFLVKHYAQAKFSDCDCHLSYAFPSLRLQQRAGKMHRTSLGKPPHTQTKSCVSVPFRVIQGYSCVLSICRNSKDFPQFHQVKDLDNYKHSRVKTNQNTSRTTKAYQQEYSCSTHYRNNFKVKFGMQYLGQD